MGGHIMKKLLERRINKTEIVLSAVITVILAVVCFLAHNNEAAYQTLMVLTELGLFGFISLYITYVVPEKSFTRRA